MVEENVYIHISERIENKNKYILFTLLLSYRFYSIVTSVLTNFRIFILDTVNDRKAY